MGDGERDTGWSEEVYMESSPSASPPIVDVGWVYMSGPGDPLILQPSAACCISYGAS